MCFLGNLEGITRAQIAVELRLHKIAEASVKIIHRICAVTMALVCGALLDSRAVSRRVDFSAGVIFFNFFGTFSYTHHAVPDFCLLLFGTNEALDGSLALRVARASFGVFDRAFFSAIFQVGDGGKGLHDGVIVHGEELYENRYFES